MTSEERDLITGLFNRLRTADANAPAKDREAEELIRQLTTQAPGAPYLLTQTILVQEHALTNAQARIQTLERQVAQAQQQAQQQQSSGSQGSGGFLAGLFGHHATPPPMPQQAPPPAPVQPQAPPYPSTMNMAPSAGGGFLRTALTTAAGVAGGAMLFQGIESLLGHNAGMFGGSSYGGGGGFLGGGARPEIIENREIVNNYYNDEPVGGGHHHNEGGGGAGGGDFFGGIPEGAADQPAHPGYEDARFDNANPFDKPVDDNSLFNTTADNSSMDNNYDADNTDAGSNNDFSGGDFAGGDNTDDDSGTA